MPWFVGLTISLALYLLPAIIAAIRRKPDVGMVFFMNLLAGWTILGWFVALAMALWKVDREKYRMQQG